MDTFYFGKYKRTILSILEEVSIKDENKIKIYEGNGNICLIKDLTVKEQLLKGLLTNSSKMSKLQRSLKSTLTDGGTLKVHDDCVL